MLANAPPDRMHAFQAGLGCAPGSSRTSSRALSPCSALALTPSRTGAPRHTVFLMGAHARRLLGDAALASPCVLEGSRSFKVLATCGLLLLGCYCDTSYGLI